MVNWKNERQAWLCVVFWAGIGLIVSEVVRLFFGVDILKSFTELRFLYVGLCISYLSWYLINQIKWGREN